MHQIKPIFLVVYVYGVVLLLVPCTSKYKQTPKTNLSLVFHVYGVVLLLASYTLVYKRAPEQAYFNCLSLWDGAFTRILYFDVQTGTQSNHFLAVYVYGVVLFLASCTSMYK